MKTLKDLDKETQEIMEDLRNFKKRWVETRNTSKQDAELQETINEVLCDSDSLYEDLETLHNQLSFIIKFLQR